MDLIINRAIPHVGQQILDYFDTPTLIQYRRVSTTWKELSDYVIVRSRWRELMDLIFPAFKYGEIDVFEALLELSEKKSIDFN